MIVVALTVQAFSRIDIEGHTMDSVDPNTVYFSQQHPFTVDYFRKTHGENWTRVPLRESPHRLFLLGDERSYRDYLAHSWRLFYGDNIPGEAVEDQISKFKALAEDISVNGIKEPTSLVSAIDGTLCAIDGNHRTSIAIHFGLALPAKITSTKERATSIVCNPTEMFGSGHRDMPYQTVYAGASVLVQGRRDDIRLRQRIISAAIDLRGKTLLDLGGNLGQTSYLAIQDAGLAQAHVVETSAAILTAAIRLAVLQNNNRAYFHLTDLSQPSDHLPACDICFCFSIGAHIGDLTNLAHLLRTRVKQACLFETHEGREIEEPLREVFSGQEFLGELKTRRLYLLYP